MRLLARAKLNLALEIGARRDDGYHDLVTVFQSIDLADVIELEPADGIDLDVTEGAAPGGRDNLVVRAAEQLRREAGVQAGARIRLRKRIPSGGGLGGGSSDAAATLVGLNELWRAGAASSDLIRLALALGSDVPFFLVGGTALGLGRGEKLVPLADLPALAVVVALPGLTVSTPEAFRAVDAAGRPGRVRSSDAWTWPLLAGPLAAALGRFENEFEAVVFSRHPELGELRARLAARGALLARMSGSGSAVFGLFEDPSAAERARADLAAGGVRAELCRTVPAAEARPRPG